MLAAAAAEVSTPTVARLVQKLGFAGFPAFQRSLRSELNEKISSPLTKREKWVDDAPEGHLLNRFTKAVIDNIGQSMAKVDPDDFETACTMLGDPERRVFVVGGRITRTLADEKVNVVAVNTLSDKKNQLARIAVTIETRDLHQLHRVMDKIHQLHNVTEVMRGAYNT